VSECCLWLDVRVNDCITTVVGAVGAVGAVFWSEVHIIIPLHIIGSGSGVGVGVGVGVGGGFVALLLRLSTELELQGVGSCVSDYSEECDADAHDGAVSSSHQMVSRKYYSISTTDHKVVGVQKYHGIFVTAALSNGAQLWCEYATTATLQLE
jgi:hypothetical protein